MDQKCPKCETLVKDLDNPAVITISRLDDSEIERMLAPSVIVKVCIHCGALFVAQEQISLVKELLCL